jgi:hypothetical protein
MTRPVTRSLHATPSLEPQWQRWLAENLMIGVPRNAVIAQLIARGCPAPVAAHEVALAEASPYFQASATLRNRLAKRDWHLSLAARAERLGSGEVPRRHRLDPATFLADHYAAQRPVVLTGLIDHWPAAGWTFGRLAALPPETPVEVQAGRDGDAEYESNAHHHRTAMPLGDFLARAATPGNDVYMTAGNEGTNRRALAALWDEIGDLPGYLVPQAGRDGFLWVGPEGTVTPWHHDLTNNLLVQVAGTKRVTLVSSAQTPAMRNHRHCYSLFAGDATMSAAVAGARPVSLTCDLGPGDALFIPVGWWHHVVGLTPTIGLSFTNFAWPNDAAEGYATYDVV